MKVEIDITKKDLRSILCAAIRNYYREVNLWHFYVGNNNTINGGRRMSEQEIRRLEGYDVKSITRTDARDCYDVVLTPRPLPDVRLRIRK